MATSIQPPQLHPSVQALLTLRHQLSMTQLAMAELLRVSPRTLQDWERGRRQPKGPSQALLERVIAVLRHEAERNTDDYVNGHLF